MGALIQSLKFNDQEIPWQWLEEAAYIESLDLSGPKIILTFSDPESVLRDSAKLKEREGILLISFADPEIRDETYFEESFVIEKITEGGGKLLVEGFAEAVSNLYRPVSDCTIYPAGAPSALIKKITGLEVVSSTFPEASVYHQLAGSRPVKVIERLAREVGARAYYLRGKFYLTSLDDLYSQDPEETYFHRKPLKYRVITHVQSSGDQKSANELISRKYYGFSFTEGFISSGTGRPEGTGIDTVDGMDLINRRLVDELSFRIPSDCTPERTVGKILEVEWHRPSDQDAPLNEAMPTNVLVGTICHYETKGRYQQKIITLREIEHE